jgi:hypothetical protein
MKILGIVIGVLVVVILAVVLVKLVDPIGFQNFEAKVGISNTTITDTSSTQATTIQTIITYNTNDMNPPSTSEAPFLVQTSSYVYYGEQLVTVAGTPELTGYWVEQNSMYAFNKGTISFPVNEYGYVQLFRRMSSGDGAVEYNEPLN